MKLYSSLPSTEYRLSSWSYVDRVKHLRGQKQKAFNQIVLARLEITKFVFFSLIELGAHIAAATIKPTLALIPLKALRQGITPRIALGDARKHLEHSLALSVSILAVPLLGLARPEWSIRLCQKMSTGLPASSRMARILHRMNNFRSTHHRLLATNLVTASATCLLVCRAWTSDIDRIINSNRGISYHWLGVSAFVVGLSAFSVRAFYALGLQHRAIELLTGERDHYLKEYHALRDAREGVGGTQAQRATAEEIEAARQFMGLRAGCSLKEINRQFRNLSAQGCRCAHPDKGGNPEPFKELVRCVAILRNNVDQSRPQEEDSSSFLLTSTTDDYLS
jgi:hypothetical protein